MNYLKQIVLLLALVEWSRGMDDERAPAHISLDQIDSVFLASISSRADYTSDTAVHPTKIQNAQNIAYHNHYVYIGAQNWLLKLNAHTLKIEQSVRYGPLHDSAFCRYSPVDECMPGHTKSLVDNHNKLLLVYAQQNALLSCWSGRQGICDVRALDDLGRLVLNSSIAAVANDPANSTVGFIASSANSQPVLYIAATYSNNGAYRADVPALSGRSLNLQPSRFMHIIGSDSHGLKSSKASIEFMSRFAKTFIVKYVHAFNLGVYNYFLTVQHADTDAMLHADRLVSKVARLCLNDLSFAKSYTEMPVKCVGVRANVDYNEMISAKHALVNGEHYLIGLFQQTARNSFNASIHKSPWTNQAVCMYKMSAVQRQFRHNINKCYSSEVMRGLNFIKPDQKCMAKRQVAERVDDDFCSSAENGLYPIGGTVPVVASAVLEFTDRLYDSVAVFEHELTNSLILKSADTLDLYDMNAMRVYRSVKVAYEKAPVESANDVWVEEREGVVYALSGGGTRLVKIDMFDCDRLTSCGQCVSESVRAQIYCGWCATSGRCSARVHCPSGGKWLSGAQVNVSEVELAAVCVDIESVEPRVIHADSLPWIHVNFGNEMSVRDHHLNYSCVFVSELKSEMETRAVWMDSSRLKCAMPHVSLIERVLINERAESGGMELADDGIFEVVPTRVNRGELGVYVKNSDEFKYGWSKSRSTALFNITVIHCGMYRSCISCVSDECSWCDNKCVSTTYKDDQTISQCVNQSQMCSSFDPATNKLLIPYTAHRPQAPLTFRLKNPPHQLTTNYVCHITMANGSPLSQPISVPLTILNKTHSSCTLTNIFTYVDPLLTNGQVQTDLRVYTGDYYIDSPSNGKLTLLFYKCEQKANDCSSCLSINRQLSCMWCGAVGSCKFMNAQSKLAALSECVGAWSNSALVPLNQCQKPHIESISPVKVPYSGGSLLTINGANLGSSFDDVISVTLVCAASVTTSTQCDLIRSGYTASKKIVCKLAAFTKSNEQCSVNVRLKTSNGQPSVLVRASQLVRLVDPVITSVEPAHVIQSAGFVWLTVNGVDLDSGRSRQLDIVDNVNDFEQRVVKCEIKNVTEHTVRCRLSDKFSTLGKKNVRLIIDEYTSINSHLKVNSDPLVKSIDHWTSFYDGGAAFQLTGFNFDSVQSAYTFVNYGDMWYSEPVSATSRLSNEKIVFETPALSDAFFAIAKSTNGPPRSHYLLQVGFLMDGFNVTLNEQRITYVPNLQPASLQTQALHLIKSNDLYTIKLTVAMATDNQHVDLIKRNFQVYIGCSLCDHGKWTDNQHYTCTLPQLVHNKSRDLYQCKPKVYRALLEQLNSAGSLRMFNMFVANSWFEMGRHGDTNIDLYTQSYQLNNVHNFIQVVERLAQEPMVDDNERSVSVLQQILHKHEQFRRESSKSALITPGLITNKNLFILSGIIASVVLILILITLSLGSVVLRLKRNSSPAYKLGCRGRQRQQRTRRHGRLHLEHIQKQMDQLELSIRPQCSHLYQQLHNDYLNELNNDLVYSLTALPLYNYKTYLYSCIFARSPNLDLIYSPLNVAMSSSMSMSNSTTNTLLSHTHTSLQKTNMSVYATIKSSSMLHSADQDTNTNTNTNTNSSKQQQFGSYGPIGEAMLLFDQLMHNKTFVSTFIEVCESHKDSFGLKEKHNFSALITLALKDNLHYLYSIIKSLLADHIRDCVSSKRGVLAGGDTLVQPLINNFVAMFMYDYQRDSQTAVHLYRLVASIASYVKMAPCDQLKQLSVHSLNEHTLLSDAVITSYQSLYVNVMLDTAVVTNGKNLYLVPLVDTDTVLQAKQKIIECVFKRANMCSLNLERAPSTHDLDLELCLILMQADNSNQTTLITLRDTEDQLVNSPNHSPTSKRLLTLNDYNIQNGSFINLKLKTSVIAPNKDNHVYMSTMSMSNEYVLYATKPHTNTHADLYHLVKPADQYTHPSSSASSPPTTTTNSKKKKKYEKLLSAKSQEASSTHTDSLIKPHNPLSHLSRLLVNKSVIQPFVDQLVESVLANRTSLPPVIVNLMAFIDSEVAKCALKSDEAKKLAHRTKVNVYFVRYWLNVIRNPELIVACERSSLVDSSLSCVAQALLDSCSWPDAHGECECEAVNRLLFVRELPKYKQMMEAFFDELQSVPATSDHEMHFYLNEFAKSKNAQMQSEAMGATLDGHASRAGHAELNSVQVLLQLYEYYEKYQHQINAALGQQQCSVLLPVHHRLVQISDLMSMSGMANNQTMGRAGAVSNPYQQISASYQPVNCYAATSDLIVSYPTMNTSVQPLNTLPHLRNQQFQPIHQQQFF